MTPFPREAYRPIDRYDPGRRPVEVDLSDNTSLWGPHPAALRVLEAIDAGTLSRYPPVYADGLKEAVARRFDVPPECVTTGCGSDDLLDSALRAACDPGERVVFPEPTFSMTALFCRMNGLEPQPLPGTAELALDAILEPAPAAIYLCSPNNPTGATVDPGLVRGLADREDGPVVLLDEAYADFADGSRIREAPETRHLVVLRTLSKAYGLAGFRVGFAVGPEEVVTEIEKSRGPYKVSRPAEAAAIAALEDEEGWVEERISDLRENRERLAAALRDRGLEPLPSRANFLLVPVPMDAGALEEALRDRGVGVRAFSRLRGVGEAVRVTVGPWPLMERFLEALDPALREAEGGGADDAGPAPAPGGAGSGGGAAPAGPAGGTP